MADNSLVMPDFPIILTTRNGVFHFFVKELALVIQASSLEEGYAALMKKRAERLAELQENGILEIVPEQPKTVLSSPRFSPINFFVKTLIVAAAVFVVVLFSTRLVGSEVDRLSERLSFLRGGPVFWESIENGLYAYAEARNDLPPQQQERLIAALRRIVDRFRPFTAEVASVFHTEACVIEAPTTPSAAIPSPR